MSRAPLLVLAGGRSQVPLVRRAAELELAPWVFDHDARAPAAGLAARFDPVSGRDPEAVLARVRERADVPPAGVIPGSAHPDALFAAAVVARALDLPGPEPDVVRRVVDKGAQLSVYTTTGVPHPRCTVAFGPEEAEAAARRAPRSVLKPGANTSGSAGVWITGPDDPDLALRARSAAAAGDGRVLVEDFVEGEEYSLDALATGDGVRVLAFARKAMRGNPPLPAGLAVEPVKTSAAEERRRRSVSTELAAALAGAFELRDTAFNVDLLWTDDGPVVLELGLAFDAKLDRVLDVAGADVYGALAALATGATLPADLEPTRGAASRFLYAVERGALRSALRTTAERAARGAGATLEWQLAEGAPMVPPRALADTLGWLLAEGETAEQAADRARAAERVVQAVLAS